MGYKSSQVAYCNTVMRFLSRATVGLHVARRSNFRCKVKNRQQLHNDIIFPKTRYIRYIVNNQGFNPLQTRYKPLQPATVGTAWCYWVGLPWTPKQVLDAQCPKTAGKCHWRSCLAGSSAKARRVTAKALL